MYQIGLNLTTYYRKIPNGDNIKRLSCISFMCKEVPKQTVQDWYGGSKGAQAVSSFLPQYHQGMALIFILSGHQNYRAHIPVPGYRTEEEKKGTPFQGDFFTVTHFHFYLIDTLPYQTARKDEKGQYAPQMENILLKMKGKVVYQTQL